MNLDMLPTFNACWNSAAALLLMIGLIFIKQKKISAHRNCMIAAFVCSSIFLCSYLYYHFYHGSTPFKGQGIIRPVYFTMLLTHTILAVVNLPLIIMTFRLAFKGDFERHKKLAKYTFSIWLYVSVTGVLVYFMLYHWFVS